MIRSGDFEGFQENAPVAFIKLRSKIMTKLLCLVHKESELSTRFPKHPGLTYVYHDPTNDPRMESCSRTLEAFHNGGLPKEMRITKGRIWDLRGGLIPGHPRGHGPMGPLFAHKSTQDKLRYIQAYRNTCKTNNSRKQIM
jgi:hypothetical protein